MIIPVRCRVGKFVPIGFCAIRRTRPRRIGPTKAGEFLCGRDGRGEVRSRHLATRKTGGKGRQVASAFIGLSSSGTPRSEPQ
jgi:hypothetical protein